MTDRPTTQDTGPATEEIASDGNTNAAGIPEAQSRRPGHAASDNFGESTEPDDQLLGADEQQGVIARWKEIQAQFVDEPRSAMQDADALVADLMQRLAGSFAAERAKLESRWASGEDVSTEDLRQGLRRYRSFFERLLAA